MKNSCNILVRKSEWKRPLSYGLEDNTKMYLEGTEMRMLTELI
jgi:hypothetical protein